MKKLNNKGMEMDLMILFMIVFLIFLLIIVALSYKAGAM